MKCRGYSLSFILSAVFSVPFLCAALSAEKKMTQQEYISKFKDDAIKEMLMHKVPASITLAQGMLESDNGNSPLAIYANNHFGIKCHKEWEGPVFLKDDDEKNECFRKYPHVLDSYSDHSLFLKSRPRYTFLFELKLTDYKAWAKGLKEAGYATDSKYSEKLIQLIEENKLYEYDNVGSLTSITPKIPHHPDKPKVLVKADAPQVFRYNNIKYVLAKEGDTFEKIAREMNMRVWQLCKYNELKLDDVLAPNQKIYLQPKRRKAAEQFHIVKEGETMHSISQLYGIKLKQLYKKNLMQPEEDLLPGEKLWLRTRKKLP